MIRNVILFIFTMCFAAAALPQLSAAKGTLSVAPSVVMLRGIAGQSSTQTLTITNASLMTLSFVMEAKDVIVRNGERVFVAPGKIAGSVAATAVFSQNTLVVAPGKRMSVDVTFTVPAQPGAHAIVALFHGTTRLKSGSGTLMTASLGTLLTLSLTDNVVAAASPLAVTLPTASSNLAFRQRLVNSGREPLFAKGILAILNGAGNLVAKSVLPSRRLLPGESTDIRAEYGGELAAGHYRALVTYDLANDKSTTSTTEFDIR
jgi:hypothetical protein